MKPLNTAAPNHNAFLAIWNMVLLFIAPVFIWVPGLLPRLLLMPFCWRSINRLDASQRQHRHACTGVLLIGPLANAGGLPA